MTSWHLTHWGRVTHLCVSKLTSIASDNGLSPGRRQAIMWNNAGILLIGPLGTNFSEILIEIPTFSLKKIRLKMSSARCRPFCLGLNVLNTFRLTEPLWKEYTDHRCIFQSWCFLCCRPGQPVELAIKLPRTWDALKLTCHCCNECSRYIILRGCFDQNTINNCRFVCHDTRPYNASTYSMLLQTTSTW